MNKEHGGQNDVMESKREAPRGEFQPTAGYKVKHPAWLGRNQTAVLRSLGAEKPLNIEFTEALWSQC
jgi:hypothetical protein